MDFLTITYAYYSKWLGEDNILNSNFQEITFLYSEERNKIQQGYSQQFDLYIFCQSDKIVVSYGNKALDKMDELKKQIKSVIPAEQVKQIIETLFDVRPKHNIKYMFIGVPEKSLKSRPLTLAEYPQYHDFFVKANPNCNNTGWLNEYYSDMVSSNLCCGIFDNNLASCSDLPDMPYMKEEVQEVGINTLEGYKGLGYATDVCVRCCKQILQNDKCPQWSTEIDNIASQKLAIKVGFTILADVITVTL